MTKKEKQILSKIKNKYGSILSFFELWDQVVNNTTMSQEQKQDIFQMINEEQGNASKSVKEVFELLNSLG